jgi:hypothetical protein
MSWAAHTQVDNTTIQEVKQGKWRSKHVNNQSRQENTLKKGLDEEKRFCGRHIVLVIFIFLEKEWRHYIPFLKDFSYMLEIHLKKIFVKHKLVK